jgi:hypothetical protein
VSTFANVLVPTTGPIQLPLGPLGNLTIINGQATNKIYLGSTNLVTTSNGVLLPDGGATVGPINISGVSGPVWAIAGVGAQSIGIITS